MKPSLPIISGLIILILLSGCGPGELFGPSVTPTSTVPPTLPPTITPIPVTNTPSITIVTGTIVDPDGLPKVDIPVQLFKNRNRDLVTETKTDAKGEYIFMDIPPGMYTVRYDIVLSSTYVLHYYTTEFIVESGTTTRQDIVHKN